MTDVNGSAAGTNIGGCRTAIELTPDGFIAAA